MKKSNEKAILRLAVEPETKRLFKDAFEKSTLKNINGFLKSILKPADALQVAEVVSKVSEPKSRFTVLVTGEEKSLILDVFHNSSEKRLGVFILKCVKNAPIKVEYITRLSDNISLELRKIGGNLNQIALRTNQIGSVDMTTNRLLEDIKASIINLKKP